MKKKIFFLILPLTILGVGACSVFKDDKSVKNDSSNNEFEVMKKADEDYSKRVIENRKEKYSDEEVYRKAVKKKNITKEFLVGDWEGIEDKSGEKIEMSFFENEIEMTAEGQGFPKVGYEITTKEAEQFLSLKGEYGEALAKIQYLDENSIRIQTRLQDRRLFLTDPMILNRKKPISLSKKNENKNEKNKEENINGSQLNSVIKDSSLSYHISKKLSINGTDITEEDVLRLTNISIDFGVKSLKGLEKAQRLNSFTIDYSLPKDSKVDLVELSPLAQIPALKEIRISAFVDGDFVKKLSNLKQLERIEFYNMYFEKLEDIEYILNKNNFPSLKVIELRNTNLESQDIDYLNGIQTDVAIKIGY
ncbi:TPA: hypothetical protein QCX99_003489 [Bacillus thuringiensis]|nr:hypothetical protein [Bacillus thuringiensis]